MMIRIYSHDQYTDILPQIQPPTLIPFPLFVSIAINLTESQYDDYDYYDQLKKQKSPHRARIPPPSHERKGIMGKDM